MNTISMGWYPPVWRWPHWVGLLMAAVLHAAVLWWATNHSQYSHEVGRERLSISVTSIQAPVIQQANPPPERPVRAGISSSKSPHPRPEPERAVSVPRAAISHPTTEATVSHHALSSTQELVVAEAAGSAVEAQLAPTTSFSAAAENAVESKTAGVAALTCQTMPEPVMPEQARLENLSGSVRAEATLREGKVVAVTILSSRPRGVFDAAVRSAMFRYSGCTGGSSGDITAHRTFEFKMVDGP